MKNILNIFHLRFAFVLPILYSVLLGMNACSPPKIEGYYGAEFPLGSTLSVTQMLEHMQELDTLTVQVEGVVSKVCQSRGCWLIMQSDNQTPIYFNVQDEAFVLPPGILGKTVVAQGVAMSVEAQKERELAEGADPDELGWIQNVAMEATGFFVK